jgi:hypothetical protein
VVIRNCHAAVKVSQAKTLLIGAIGAPGIVWGRSEGVS